MARVIWIVALMALAACNGEEEAPTSQPTDPTVEFEVPVPEVDTDWPLGQDSDTND